MSAIFKSNILTAVTYTVLILLFSLLFKNNRAIVFSFIYYPVIGIHCMIVFVQMSLYHFKPVGGKRNSYIATFGALLLLLVIVQVIFYVVYENQSYL